MSDGITISFTGLDEMLRELRELPAKMQQNVIRGAAAKGASVLRLEAVTRAPDSASSGPVMPAKGHPPPGTLKRAIYQTRVPSQCTATREVFRVDVRRGKKASKSAGGKSSSVDAFYASWVEYGHYARVPHAMTKTAKAAGRALGVAKWVPAHPFMRPALQAKSNEAIEAMRAYIAQQLPLAGAAARYLKFNVT
jgi:HK97 gp10 family phage protein